MLKTSDSDNRLLIDLDLPSGVNEIFKVLRSFVWRLRRVRNFGKVKIEDVIVTRKGLHIIINFTPNLDLKITTETEKWLLHFFLQLFLQSDPVREFLNVFRLVKKGYVRNLFWEKKKMVRKGKTWVYKSNQLLKNWLTELFEKQTDI